MGYRLFRHPREFSMVKTVKCQVLTTLKPWLRQRSWASGDPSSTSLSPNSQGRGSTTKTMSQLGMFGIMVCLVGWKKEVDKDVHQLRLSELESPIYPMVHGFENHMVLFRNRFKNWSLFNPHEILQYIPNFIIISVHINIPHLYYIPVIGIYRMVPPSYRLIYKSH